MNERRKLMEWYLKVKPKYVEENTHSCPFPHHKFLTNWPGINPRPPWYEVHDCTPERWYNNMCNTEFK
jgi:hypothetical protein